MAAKFTMIRVSLATLTRLKAEIAKRIASQEKGETDAYDVDPEPINPRCPGISIDALINMLLDEPARKRRAARESDAKRRAARRAAREQQS